MNGSLVFRAATSSISSAVLNNRLWGAERIRGKLLKLGIRVALEDRTH